MDKLMNYLLALLLASGSYYAQAQSLSIWDCYEGMYTHFPLQEQSAILEEIGRQKSRKAGQTWVPKFDLSGQYTWQNEVTSLNLPPLVPGFEVPVVPKDQYKLLGEISQTLFDGGATKALKASEGMETLVQKQQVAVQQHQLKEQINQLFFSILLQQKQLAILALIQEDLNARKQSLQSLYENGMVSKKEIDRLQVEMLKVEQQKNQILQFRQSSVGSLHTITGLPISENTSLEMPDLDNSSLNARPELQLFSFQIQALDQKKKLLSTGRLPKLNAFATGGIGRPGFNFLDDQAAFMFQTGIRMKWSLSNFYTDQKDRQILSLSQLAVQNQQKVFETNLDIQKSRLLGEIRSLEDQLSTDDAIVALQEGIKNLAASQLENGIINAVDYLIDLNDWKQAVLTRDSHSVQIALAKLNFQTITGNSVQ